MKIFTKYKLQFHEVLLFGTGEYLINSSYLKFTPVFFYLMFQRSVNRLIGMYLINSSYLKFDP